MIYKDKIPEEFTEVVSETLVNNLDDKKMNNGIGKLTRENVKSALVYCVLWGLLALVIYAIQVGSVFKLDWHNVVDSFVFGFLGFLVSTLKNLLTTNDGKFAGVVEVK